MLEIFISYDKRRDKRINIRGKEDKKVGNSVQTARNCSKTNRELVLEMRITAKREEGVELF